MNEFYIRNVVEAALLAAGKSLQLAELGQIFDESARPKAEDIRAALEVLTTEYSGRAVEIKETAAGFRIQVRKEFASEISRLWPERPAKYSRALLETLALIAYRQPITRAEIEAVRGVAVNPNILKTVIERNWVRVVGHRDVPGRPELLGTTREFLDYFGLRTLDELPPLTELKAMGEYNLQLELPNAGALGIESSGTGAVGGAEVAGVGVAGLLVSELTGRDAAGFVAGAGGDGDVIDSVAAIAEAVSVEDAGTSGAEAADAEAGDVEAVDAGTADADSDTYARIGAAGVAGGGVGDAEVAGAGASGDGLSSVEPAVVEFEGVELGGPDLALPDIAEAPSMEWAAVAEAHSPAVVGNGEDSAVVAEAAVSEAIEADGDDESDADDEGADAEAEADRTLSADFAANSGATPIPDAADSEDSEPADSAIADKRAGTLADASADDDDDDEDELSADGHDSRELVAAPRDVDD
ncbi:MAG: segregation and condensation protein [Gammaproteobacteria bacterium]|nr:segregation and condensation protein [Gammaproteobacteria bacterium]